MAGILQLLGYNSILIHHHLLTAGVLLIFFSILIFSVNKPGKATAVLFAASIFLNIYSAHLDPFLNPWDERFHALAAKSMAVNPFRPMLYTNPVLPYDYQNWTGNHIWVHKQPLFLWQMAVCIRLFGVNEFAIRIPSALMGALMVPVVFRMGSLAANRNVGYYAAFLCCTNNFILEHVTGKESLDHNDMAFLFYVTLSIWAWLEFENSGKKRWVILVGIFSGAAILIKWLTALLVYAGYTFYHLLFKRDLFKRDVLLNLFYSLLITTLVALPWQFFILYKFPLETLFEYNYNSRHFLEILDNHSGDALYYITTLSKNYSSLQIFIYAGIIVALLKHRNRSMLISIVFMVALFYIFFSSAKTKMVSFVMPVASLCFILMALWLEWCLGALAKYRRIYAPLVVGVLSVLCIKNINPAEFADSHLRNINTYWGKYAQKVADNTVIYKSLDKILPANTVIGFCNTFENINCMYYAKITAYGGLTEENIAKLKTANFRIAVFNNHLPPYVLNDPSITILPADYKSD